MVTNDNTTYLDSFDTTNTCSIDSSEYTITSTGSSEYYTLSIQEQKRAELKRELQYAKSTWFVPLKQNNKSRIEDKRIGFKKIRNKLK